MPHPYLVSSLFIPSLYPSLFNSNNFFILLFFLQRERALNNTVALVHGICSVHACMNLQFEGGSYFFELVKTVASIRGQLLFGVWLLFK